MNDTFENIFGPCVEQEHMLEFHKIDEITGTIYDYCLKCEYMVPRQVAE